MSRFKVNKLLRISTVITFLILITIRMTDATSILRRRRYAYASTDGGEAQSSFSSSLLSSSSSASVSSLSSSLLTSSSSSVLPALNTLSSSFHLSDKRNRNYSNINSYYKNKRNDEDEMFYLNDQEEIDNNYDSKEKLKLEMQTTPLTNNNINSNINNNNNNNDNNSNTTSTSTIVGGNNVATSSPSTRILIGTTLTTSALAKTALPVMTTYSSSGTFHSSASASLSGSSSSTSNGSNGDGDGNTQYHSRPSEEDGGGGAATAEEYQTHTQQNHQKSSKIIEHNTRKNLVSSRKSQSSSSSSSALLLKSSSLASSLSSSSSSFSSTLSSSSSAAAAAAAAVASGTGIGAAATRSSSSSQHQQHAQQQYMGNRNKHHHEHHWGPFFEEPHSSTSEALQLVTYVATEAALNCRVGMLQDKTVMWIRRTSEKVSLLTVGNVTYSGDPRINLKFQYPNNWRLVINPVQKEDAGLYMCQVSTHPPKVFATNLTVLDHPIKFTDEKGLEVKDRFYKAGSTIDLTCQISRKFFAVQQQQQRQQHQQQLNLAYTINLNKHHRNKDQQEEINLKDISNTNIESQWKKYLKWQKDGGNLPPTSVNTFSSTDKWHKSRIVIPKADFENAGLYTCSYAKAYEAAVHVQILIGELPAAVQHNAESSVKAYLPGSFMIVFLLNLYNFLYITTHIYL